MIVIKIDYISDIHIENLLHYYSKNKKIPKKETIEKDISHILSDMLLEKIGDVLIIAGDVSEDNLYTLFILSFFARYYKKVFFVFGNHDLWIRDQEEKYNWNSKNRKYELKETVRNGKYKDKIIILDNTTYEYKGVKFSGTSLWYTLPKRLDKIRWKLNFNDSRYIYPKDIEASEKRHDIDMTFYQGLNNQNCDILVTHVPPKSFKNIISNLPRFLRGSLDNAFVAHYKNLSIDMNDISIKHWVCGHLHLRKTPQHNNTNFYINSSGTLSELLFEFGEPKIKSFVFDN